MATLHLRELAGPDGAEPPRVAATSVSVAPGEVVALVGPSGAGKSTLLRLVAGLETPSAGEVWLDDRRLDTLPVPQRDVGLVTADATLTPHLDVAGNIGFPLRLRGVAAGERRRRVRAEAAVSGVRRLLGRRPRTLAAGEQQATALARETARLPSVLLLDEPMARLDAGERVRLRAELGAYLRALGAPTLLATNDQIEAMSLADRLAVIRAGHIVQIGVPQQVYDEPASAFVAGFLGQPGANLLEGRLAVGRRGVFVEFADGAWASALTPTPALQQRDGTLVTVACRPEHLAMDVAERAWPPAKVTHLEPTGPHTLAHVERDDGDGGRLVAWATDDPAPTPGTWVRVGPTSPSALTLFDPERGQRLTAPADDDPR